MEKQRKTKRNNKNRRKKVCHFCLQGTTHIDYKDVDFLQKSINQNCKIVPRRISGCCKKHQSMVANAIKRARTVALLPFVKEFE